MSRASGVGVQWFWIVGANAFRIYSCMMNRMRHCAEISDVEGVQEALHVLPPHTGCVPPHYQQVI